MESCAGKADEAMEDIIPTIMSALSMNHTEEIAGKGVGENTASTLGVRRRLQQQQTSSVANAPLARNTVENSHRLGRQDLEKEFCGTTEGTVDDIIPTIMNALSFRDAPEEIPRKNSINTSVSHHRRLQQQPQINSTDTDSILNNLDSSFRERKQQQKDRNSTNNKLYAGSTKGAMQDKIPSIINSISSRDVSEDETGIILSIINSLSFRNTSEETIRRNMSNQTDPIPSIVNALSFRDTSEETMKRSRNDKIASHRQQRQLASTQVPLGRNTSNSSYRRRLNDDTGLSHTTIAEEDSFQKTFSNNEERIGESKRTPNSPKDSGYTFQNTSSKIDEKDETMNEQVFSSIRNMFALDDGVTKRTQNEVTGNGLNQVYPFIRNVFSMNDIDSKTIPLNTKEEISENTRKVRPLTRDEEKGNNISQTKTKPTQKIVVTRAYEVKEHYLESLFYVSISAILGSVFRVYMARIFGLDCQAKQAKDFLAPFSTGICVTANGRTEQTGGALFTDFPSNVFGSFLMGMITPPLDDRRARLPWLHRDHPLQRDEVFHASLGTGFCGCLTTFASWNTQMVVMLDGTYCQLGSQVVTVLFGYLIGLMGASYGFQLGRQCGLWMYNYRHKNDDEASSRRDGANMDDSSDSQPSLQNGDVLPDEGIELVDDGNVQLQPVPSHLHKIPLFLTAVALLVAFLIGDVVNGIRFYKGMILLWILSPVGSLLRWKMSGLNKIKKGRIITGSADWIPWGTFFANLLATIISACIEGLYHRYFDGANPTSTDEWVDAMLFALKTGVAGSLSTVSTVVKESVHLSEDHPGLAHGHYYSMLTCVTCCLVGLAVYSTTIRIS